MRYSLQRYGTWEWLDFEAPIISSDAGELALSAYGVMRATVPAPAAHRTIAQDGRPMFERWGTIVHLESGDTRAPRRHWTGVVESASLGSSGWDLTLRELVGYPAGVPYEGLIRAAQADPADVLRQLVTDLQSLPGGWYGCTIEGSTPIRVGTDLDNKVAAARAAMDARKQTLDAFSKTSREQTKELQDLDSTLSDEVTAAQALLAQAQQQVAQLVTDGADPALIAAAKATVTARQATYQAALAGYNTELAAGRSALAAARATKDEAQSAYDAAKAAYDALKERRKTEGGAYEISGADLPDTYREIQALASECGFEWTTRTRYSAGAPDVAIVIHYPRAGSRRDDLIFDTSVNIIDALELDDGDYANAVIGVGAGEGPAAVRVSLSEPTSRMRRPVVVEDRSLRTAEVLRARARTVLRASTGEPRPLDITVRDHPNAPIGSWQVGDIITVRGVTTIGSTWQGLARIRSWSWVSRTRARINLDPA
ncbi:MULTISPECIES: hypothetical protein [unclassified Leucobacter]|uniref:hypothetical protein n=1 Tax=unclassified Leucobacter TaxID=2621730 RepID=UPI003019AAE2